MSVLTDDLAHTLGTQAPSTDWIDTSTPCRSNDPELWFAERPDEVAFAQTLCGGCALRTACLAGALERREPWGVWGGELFERGQVVALTRELDEDGDCLDDDLSGALTARREGAAA